MARFRKRPEEVEAIQWTGANLDELRATFGSHGLQVDEAGLLVITGVTGSEVVATAGDWIVQTSPGSFSNVAPEVMAAAYEPAPATTGTDPGKGSGKGSGGGGKITVSAKVG